MPPCVLLDWFEKLSSLLISIISSFIYKNIKKHGDLQIDILVYNMMKQRAHKFDIRQNFTI